MPHSRIKITADYRERPSGIPGLLSMKNVEVSFASLPTGDFIINNDLTVERKSASDFIQSIASNRLFEQCAKLKRQSGRALLMVEGNPYKTGYGMDHNAIKGAIVSILIAWQIPVIYTKSPEDSANLLILAAGQSLNMEETVRMSSYKPKKIKTKQLRLLQSLPGIGPVLAKRLLEHFGTIKSVVNASGKELRRVQGIGRKGANAILEFTTGTDSCA